MLLRHRWSVTIALGSAVFVVAYAAAAGLGINPASLAAGGAAVEACDPDGVTTAFTRPAYDGSTYVVDRVKVQGIDAACIGRDFAVMLVDAGSAQLAEAQMSSVSSGSFGGSADALTLEFDFAGARVPSDRVQAVLVSIFR